MKPPPHVPTTRRRCPTGKYRYRNRRLTLQAISLARKGGATVQTAYRCPTCNGWHMTSQPPNPMTQTAKGNTR